LIERHPKERNMRKITSSVIFALLLFFVGAPCAVADDADFTLDLDASYGEGTFSLDFTLGTPEACTWVNYLILTSPSVQVIPLWSVPLPVIDPPIVVPVAFPFPSLGTVGFWTGLFTGEGAEVVVFEWIDTGEQSLGSETELAGRSLGDYPFFEYVRAINSNESVKVAIDPTRFPEISGQTCDVYIVEAKTALEWDFDPSLTDVRPGGPQTRTFLGTTIQDNTFTVALAGQLDSDAGIGLGVGYDVVLDCDRDGELGDADYSDGSGDEAGFYSVHDTTLSGPLSVREVTYSGGSWLDQNTYYPTNIATMGELPLIVVSHGNGHNYRWYDHIGYHMASYGYIVMSHSNNTGPGIETASTTTLTNTDYIIGNQASIQGGALNGHIDSSRITWIGHSRGGEGVVRAHTRVRTGSYNPSHFDIDDVALVSSIAPVTHLSPASSSTPHDVNYHIFIAAADDDVTGSPSSGSSKPMAIYERSSGNKQMHYVQGAGHGDFHDGGGSSVADGPALIGRSTTHKVVKGYYLPLIQLYVDGNAAAKDFFTRMYERFHPIGIPQNVIIANMYRDAVAAGNLVIDDYETQTSTTMSSSFGTVTYDVQHLGEVVMKDTDGSFAWTGSQPENGMTYARYSDESPRCAVFDWSLSGGSRYYELGLNQTHQYFSDKAFLSFRACQGTRHTETDALDSPLSFTVSLRDGSGTTSSIPFESYGRITRTYQRTGYGSGAGWANEFNTVRIRVADFEVNESGINLAAIVAVRFDFGSSFGSSRGRIGIDDIEVTLE